MTSNTLLNVLLIYLILSCLQVNFLFCQPEFVHDRGYHPPVPDLLHSYYQSLTISNTAAASLIDFSFMTASFENQFLLKELMAKNISSFFRVNENTFTCQVDHFGYSGYGNMALSGGYSRLFGRSFAVGMRFHYLLDHASSYPARHSFTFDLSFQALIARKYGIGILLYNPAKLKYGITGQIIPVLFDINAFYVVNDRLLLWGRIQKELPGGFDLLLGFSYRWKPIAISANVSLTHCGLSGKLRWRSFEFEIRSKYHYRLGFSPALAIYYLLKS